jgi:hypothetical protein
MKTFNQSVVTLALLVFAAPVFAAEQEGVQSRVLQRTLDAMRKPAVVVPAVQPVHVAPVVIPAQPVIEQVSRNPEGVAARTLAAIRNEVPAVVQSKCELDTNKFFVPANTHKAFVDSMPNILKTCEALKKMDVPAELQESTADILRACVALEKATEIVPVSVDANIALATEGKEVVQEATKEAAQTTKSWLWSKTGQFVCAMKNAVEPFWMKCQKLQYEATKALDNKYVLAGVSAVATLATAAACYKGFKMYQAYQAKKVEQKK